MSSPDIKSGIPASLLIDNIHALVTGGKGSKGIWLGEGFNNYRDAILLLRTCECETGKDEEDKNICLLTLQSEMPTQSFVFCFHQTTWRNQKPNKTFLSTKNNLKNLLEERNDESKHKMLNHLTRNLWSFQFWRSEKYFYEKVSKMKKFSHHTLLFYTDTRWELLPSVETCRSCSSPQLVSRSQAPTQPQHEWPCLHACCF